MEKYKFVIRTYYSVAVECQAASAKEAKEMVRRKLCEGHLNERDFDNYLTEIESAGESDFDTPDYTITANGCVTELT